MCDYSFQFTDFETRQIVPLTPDNTYISISRLDHNGFGYEGVVPGDTCIQVVVSEDACINHGRLTFSVATYSDAFHGTEEVTNLESNGMSSSDITRRTGITMFFGGDAIKFKIIDTAGFISWKPDFTAITLENPKAPVKSCSLQ